MVRSRLTRGKYIPAIRRGMSRPMRSRQIALRRLSRRRNPALKRIRSRAKYNLFKLNRGLRARALIRGALKRFRARQVLRRGMRKFALRNRVKNLATMVRLQRYHNRMRRA